MDDQEDGLSHLWLAVFVVLMGHVVLAAGVVVLLLIRQKPVDQVSHQKNTHSRQSWLYII